MYIDLYVACSRHHRVAMASNFVNGNKPSAIPCKYKLCSIQMFIFNDKKFNSCSFHIVSAVFVKILEKPFLGNVSYKVSHGTRFDVLPGNTVFIGDQQTVTIVHNCKSSLWYVYPFHKVIENTQNLVELAQAVSQTKGFKEIREK